MKNLLSVLFVFWSFILTSQVNQDSLWNKWSDVSNADSARLNAIGSLAWHLHNEIPDSAFHLAQLQNKLAKQLKADFHLAQSLKIMGVSCHIKGEYNKALMYYLKSYEISQKINDLKGVAACASNIGIIYKHQSNYMKAIEYLDKSLTISLNTNNKKQTANTLNNLADLFNEQGDYNEALNYYNKSKIIYEELNDQFTLASSINNIGLTYLAKNELDSAYSFFNKSYKLYIKLDDLKRQAVPLNNLGIIFLRKQEYVKAIKNFNKCLEIVKMKFPDKYIEANTLNNLGNVYYKKSNYKKALNYCLDAFEISNEIGSVEEIKNSSLYSYLIYKALNNEKKALQMFEIYVDMKDSISNQLNTKALLKQEYKIKFEDNIRINKIKQEKEKKLLNKEKKINELELQKKEEKIYFFLSIFISVFVLGIIVYLYRQKIIKSKRDLEIQSDILNAVIQGEEKERKRIAIELHDGIGQMLTSVKINLESISSMTPEFETDINTSKKAVDKICNEVRSISHQMLPKALEISGIIAALEQLLFEFFEGTKITYEFNHYGVKRIKLSADMKLGIYRIVQEMINNIVKHSEATEVAVQLLKNNNLLILIVEDNGKGFNFKEKVNLNKGAGLSNIKSRVQLLKGEVNFQSSPQQGSVITLRMPINE